jgi:hypothetical protein
MLNVSWRTPQDLRFAARGCCAFWPLPIYPVEFRPEARTVQHLE